MSKEHLVSDGQWEKSPAMRLLQTVWEDQGTGARNHSWGRLNSAMSEALALAVAHRFRFNLGDFSQIAKPVATGGFSFDYWGGVDGQMWGERFYSLACMASTYSRWFGVNLSACLSFEKWKGRPPFVLKDTTPRGRRLAVGSRFLWQGERVKVTSFRWQDSPGGVPDAEPILVACSYSFGTGERKIRRRHRITMKDLVARNLRYSW